MPQKVCDNKSVGVVIIDNQGRILMIQRTKYPIAIAPIAGHLDGLTPEQARDQEVFEEGGVKVLEAFQVLSLMKQNKCSRKGGDHHFWTIFEVTRFEGKPKENFNDAAKNPKWYTVEETKSLAQRTADHERGVISEEAWLENPGLEQVWVEFFRKLKIL